MIQAEELVAAGAYLSCKEKLKNESAVDTMSARCYRHPAIGDRPVVRLTADKLAEGDDLTMEFLGFAKPEVTGPVAKRQKQALGFPGWAIVNDPQHARYALELVKEFKKAVRRSKAKPGFGYDEFTEISKRLGKSVAHFLPSFWEQAGREFIALDNATYGSRAFGKAREAEKIHALKVDESLRQDAFLEFALAGAVSIKALTEYGKELLSTHDPKSAWTFFRELCVRRTLGGMPPWTSLIKDLQPLMKAAGLNQEQEIRALILEMIDSPAISRASMGFWESASKGIAQLAVMEPHVAGVLLNMIPQTSSWRNDDIWPWLNYLDAWGILSNAWKDEVADEAKPAGGPAAWFTRLIRSIDRPRQKIFDILEVMAPRLRKDNVPVDLYQTNRWNRQASADVDLIDLALELKIPFTEVPSGLTFSLSQWAVPADPAKDLRNRPRDPVHLVADPRFTSALHDALQVAAGESAFEFVATGKVALQQARRNWLISLVEGLANGGLPRVESSLKLIEDKTRRAIFLEFPDVLEKLQAIDIRPAIARSLRGGLMDEYGWPALERVYESFVAGNTKTPLVFGHFPYLIVTDGLKVVVLKGEEVVHETELKLPKGFELKSLKYLDGDILATTGANYESSCFWNSDPQTGDKGYSFHNVPVGGVSVDVPGGGTFIGDKIIHRGKKGLVELHANDFVVCDGTHWWMKSGEYEPTTYRHFFVLHEIDPVSGKKGRKSMPSFFEDFVQGDSKLEVTPSSLLPVGDNFPKSPLGVRDGLIGFRFRRSSNGTCRIEGIDGRAFEANTPKDFDGLLTQPGTDLYLPVQAVRQHRKAIGFTWWDPTGSYEVAEISGGGDSYSRGQVTGVTATFLHAFQIRDLAASRKLRTTTELDVQNLLQAEQQDFDNFTRGNLTGPEGTAPSSPAPRTGIASVMQKLTLRDEVAHSTLLDAAIRTFLGQDVHPRLLAGLRGLMIRAGQKTRQLAKVIEIRSVDPVAQTSGVEIATADAAAAPFLESIRYSSFRPVAHVSFMESTARVAKFFNGESTTVHFPQQWVDVLRRLSQGVAQRLWSSYCTDPADQRWVPFAESWSNLQYNQLPGWFRMFTGENSEKDFLAAEKAAVITAAEQSGQPESRVEWAIPYLGKSSRYLISKNYNGYQVLEYSPDGTFESIPNLTEQPQSIVTIPPPAWRAEALRSFITLAKANSINFPSVDLLKSLAADVKASVAEVALVWFGLPNIDDYSSNFMPTHLREGCKLKTKECSTAKTALKAMPENLLNGLVRAVVSGEPADLWEQPPQKVADRIRIAWQGEQIDRLQLDSEWMDKLSGTFGYGVDKHQFFQALNAPLTHPLLSDQGVWKFGKGQYSTELICEDNRFKFNTEILRAAGNSIAMLAYGLPVGDPARNKIGEIYQATIKALANPNLLLAAGSRYDHDPGKGPKLSEIVESIVGKLKTQEAHTIADDGNVVVACDQYRLQIAFRPARVVQKDQATRVSNQLKALLGTADQDESASAEALQQTLLLRCDDFQALVARVKHTPVAVGSYETNPKLSAPELVQQIVKALKLSEDAAAYYLQLITLADPTDKNVALWNGWTTATIKKVGAELLDKKLVLEASRARAGRKFFLPGGWEDLKAPHLPIETWKLILFKMTRDAYQRATPPLGRIVPVEPVHTLFAKAWKRIVDGDLPKYDEVK